MSDLKKFDTAAWTYGQCVWYHDHYALDLNVERLITKIASNSNFAATGPGFSGPVRSAPKPKPLAPTGPPRVPMAGTRKLAGDSHA